MNDLISRELVIDAIERNAFRHTYIDQIIDIVKALPSAESKATLLHATKIVLEFIESCDGTTALLITPDGDRLSCDWGYVEDGMRELIRYAERRTDG